MKKDGRYDVAGLTEAQFEPCSNDLVLRNRLGITSPQEMDDAEARALERAMVGIVGKTMRDIALLRPISVRFTSSGSAKYTNGQGNIAR